MRAAQRAKHCPGAARDPTYRRQRGGRPGQEDVAGGAPDLAAGVATLEVPDPVLGLRKVIMPAVLRRMHEPCFELAVLGLNFGQGGMAVRAVRMLSMSKTAILSQTMPQLQPG